MQKELQLKDLNTFIRRRKRSFLYPFLIVFCIGVAISIALPPLYRSQAKILIEEPEISSQYIQSTATGYAEERIRALTEQILSRSRLMDIIKQVESKPLDPDPVTQNQMVSELRNNINVAPISATVTSERTGRALDLVTAFIVSYDDRNPFKAQKVATLLADLFIQEDVKSREKQASATTSFLQSELDKLKQQTREYERRIGEFKEKHIGLLPEYTDIHLRTIESLERKLDTIEVSIKSAQERYITVKSQLASVDPMMPVTVGGEHITSNPYERLEVLRLKLLNLKTNLSEKHPDVRRVQSEIQELESQLKENGKGGKERVYWEQLQAARANLTALQEKYGENHPDVIIQKKEIEALFEKIKKTGQANSGQVADIANNPTYINLRAQVLAIKSSWDALLNEKEQIKNQIAEYRQKLEKIPMVENQYLEMTRDYERTKNKYDDLFDKLMAAKVAMGMEETQKGEKFTLVDRASLPSHPYKPNRIAFIAISFVLALGAGMVLATLREALDSTVKSEDDLQAIVTVPVLSVVEMMETKEEKRGRKVRLSIVYLSLAMCGSLLLLFIHFKFMPIDQLFVKVVERLLNL